jgi:hypothetical protein
MSSNFPTYKVKPSLLNDAKWYRIFYTYHWENNYAEVIYGNVKIILKYSYGNHILGEINITRKLVKNLLLHYFEFNILKCNFSRMKHTLWTTSNIIFSLLPTEGSHLQQQNVADMTDTEDWSYQHTLFTICLTDCPKWGI